MGGGREDSQFNLLTPFLQSFGAWLHPPMKCHSLDNQQGPGKPSLLATSLSEMPQPRQ